MEVTYGMLDKRGIIRTNAFLIARLFSVIE